MVNTVKKTSTKSVKNKNAQTATTRRGAQKKTNVSAENVLVSKKFRNPLAAYRSLWKRGLQWRGTSSRSEYWWAVFVNFVILFGLLYAALFITGLGTHLKSGWLVVFGFVLLLIGGALGVLTFIPMMMLSIRRLHDSGLSGYWVLLDFVGILAGRFGSWGEILGFCASLAFLVMMLWSTKFNNNPYHKFNRE